MPGSKQYTLSSGDGTAKLSDPVSKEMELSAPNTDVESSEDSKEYPPAFAGMGKDMVLHYSNTPGFNRARKILLVIFWGSWLVLMGAVIYLTVTHPRCKVKPTLDWWQKASVYQVYPRSFMDSNGDGVGDINGLTGKLEYLKSIKVDAVWLSPFYKSPLRDFGYDVTNYTEVDPQFGTMQDFDDLLQAMHDTGLKLIIDFIPNHTSNESYWFDQSVSRVEPYDNYYIWRDCGTANNITPPNNWQSVVLGESAWEYHPIRGQCYFHQYQKSMPDLNFRNNKVKDAIDDVLRFWLDKGVDGIRVDAITKLYEDYDMEDEPVLDPTADQNDYYSGYLNHTMTRALPEIMDMINRWRGVLDEYSYQTNNTRVLIAEATEAPDKLTMYYGRTKHGGAHFPFNFQLTSVNNSCGGDCFSRRINDWMINKPENATANWVLGNHDRPRIASRVGEDKIDAMNMLLALLPGVSTTYYGDEIGMMDIDISDPGYISQDPVGKDDKNRSRDPQRSPMQWNNETCSGFTTNCSAVWLPMHSNADTVNVQIEEADPSSHLSVYKKLMSLRGEETFIYGHWRVHHVTDSLYSFRRFYDGLSTYLVLVNVGQSAIDTLDVSSDLPVTSATVSAVTGGLDIEPGSTYDLKQVTLQPGDGLVCSWPYIIKEL